MSNNVFYWSNSRETNKQWNALFATENIFRHRCLYKENKTNVELKWNKVMLGFI